MAGNPLLMNQNANTGYSEDFCFGLPLDPSLQLPEFGIGRDAERWPKQRLVSISTVPHSNPEKHSIPLVEMTQDVILGEISAITIIDALVVGSDRNLACSPSCCSSLFQFSHFEKIL
jgi:hypothetical protein